MKKFLLALLAIAACNIAASAAIKGDVDGDGEVTSGDVTVLYNYLLMSDDSSMVNGDVDGDGEITSGDLTVVYNILLGVDTPVEPPAPVIEFTVNGVTFKMVEVEGGTFVMGTPSQEGVVNPTAAHDVTLTTYCIGQTEVTQELWVAVMGYNPSYFNEKGNPDYYSYHEQYECGINLQRPVDYINIADCEAFIAKLNELTGCTFRIPTEAEWEFAARGGNLSQGYTYPGSNNVDEVAWYRETIPTMVLGGEGWGPQSVATLLPNELGIYDMGGNDEEWCNDWYGNYPADPVTNPTGPATGNYRVTRGGKWNSYAISCTPQLRAFNNAAVLGNSRTLRLAMTK